MGSCGACGGEALPPTRANTVTLQLEWVVQGMPCHMQTNMLHGRRSLDVALLLTVWVGVRRVGCVAFSGVLSPTGFVDKICNVCCLFIRVWRRQTTDSCLDLISSPNKNCGEPNQICRTRAPNCSRSQASRHNNRHLLLVTLTQKSKTSEVACQGTVDIPCYRLISAPLSDFVPCTASN
jgi:hypothetical protein